jgi:hypothetical protein
MAGAMNALLAEIEAFMATHKMGAAAFGIAAMGDKHFIQELRNGRRTWPETETKVRLFMATYRAAA